MRLIRWILTGVFAATISTASQAFDPPTCPAVVVPPSATLPDYNSLPPGISIRDTHERTTGVLWFQTAAEYQVDSLVKYRQAAAALDSALADPTWTAALEQTATPLPTPTAVIMDLDETVLDNSRFQGELVRRRSGYDGALWNDWVTKESAWLVPGALKFIQYVMSKGVTVFFVTNRTNCQEANTRDNLSKLGIRLPDPAQLDTVLTTREQPDWTSDKGTRRSFIAKNYRILLLIGDDLGDFVSKSALPSQDRTTLAERYMDKWGTRWFLINNPLYGGWEAATYDNDFGKSDADALKEKNALVKGFAP